jgi:hypothetical protein
MLNELQSQTSENLYARTNRELFRPRWDTGNPQYDFFTHYSHLSQLQRLDLESHTVNGNQISRYEPDISHSTMLTAAPAFVGTVQRRAHDVLSSAAIILSFTINSPALAAADCVQDALRRFDSDAVGIAETLLSTDTTAPEFPALANAFAASFNLQHPATGVVKSVDHSQEVKIAAPEYAARKFGNSEDAAEFVRCLHLIAGRAPSALYLQQLASHYYAEAKRRPANDVLKEMGLLALEMAAVTATNEQLEFGGDEAEGDLSTVVGWNDPSFFDEEDARLSISERRTRWMERAAQVLGEGEAVERGSIFSSELQAQTRLVYRKTAGVFDHDEYTEYLSRVSAATEDDYAFGAYLDSFERVLEQYDEGFAVSLHMTDTDRKIACGELEDDVDEESLPECARHLGDELRRLYTGGFPLHDRGAGDGVEGVTLTALVRDPITRERVSVPVTVHGIDTWLDAAVDEAFGGRVARTLRRYVWLPDAKRQPRQVVCETVVPRFVEMEVTKRGKTIRREEVRHYIERSVALVPCSRLYEQIETVDVCPNPDERAETREVLEILLQKLKRDYHMRGLNVSAVYRDLTARLAAASDTATVAAFKREAWQHKEAGRLSVKLFTAFNTHAVARQARLEAEPLCEARPHRVVHGVGFTMTKTFADGAHKFIVAQGCINMIPRLTGKTVGEFASSLSRLPRQEQERVRRAFQQGNPRLYARVREGLRAELEQASVKKLCYFRWAFYAGNKPEHPVHTLAREDQAAAWEILKARSKSGAATPETMTVEAESEIAAVTNSRPRPVSRPAVRKQQIVVTRVAASVA